MNLFETASIIAALIVIVSGCGVESESISPLSDSDKLSGRDFPAPTEHGFTDCGNVVLFTFDGEATNDDLDRAVGPRVEKWECIHGSRIRIEGTAEYTFKGGSRINGDSPESFTIRLLDGSKLGFEWPDEIRGQRVVVEGCLSRTFYPRELSRPDISKWTEREKQTRNLLRAYPFGFVYSLRDFTFELVDNAANYGDARGE
jgi:hypothetical protein